MKITNESKIPQTVIVNGEAKTIPAKGSIHVPDTASLEIEHCEHITIGEGTE